MKRTLDILLSASALIILSPVLLVVAVLVRLKLGSPIIFSQTRIGLNNQVFHFIKFRTMRTAHSTCGEPLPDEQRMTTFGQLLRRLSLDELPQLWLVLKGDMSLVGPRPLLLEYKELYSARQARRHEVKPGITGWAQVNGRNAISWPQKLEYDVWYIDNQSLLLDLKILFLTLLKVIRSQGISQQGCVTAQKFKGEQ